MGIKDFIKSEFIDIIEWTDENAGNTMVFKYPDDDNEIKNKAQLIVRESQVAVFVNEGVIADVYGPGHHELATANMPILSTLKGWKYGFESPFKVDVYFVNTRQFIDQKWGTANPVIVRDKDFGMVRIRSFGIYSFKVKDAAVFLKEVFGTCASYETEDITGHLKSSMVSELSDLLAESGVAVLDMSTQYNELSTFGLKKFDPIFEQFGLELKSFKINNISVPKEVEAMIDTKTQMGVLGDMNQYAQFQTAQAIKDAANNEGGGIAGAGVGLGAGVTMGNMMAGAFSQQQAGAAGAPMVKCPNCNANVAQGAKFCPECGTSMAAPTVACVKCGRDIKQGVKFCPECGATQGAALCTKCGAALKPDAKFCPECGTATQ
ncbi:MAG: zinc-ribbon domain-containing protein [Clostridia bacterium]|jgi:membrane protease subunit (stomatin/prohibitin family)|nr:zinc-ribbon domain-containing protein [Clostridia bacterium]MBT7122033.1 zinc-ribbon domain-containing protein [Clostridia bacterium]